MATKQFQNAKLNVTHLDLKDDASRSVLQSGENISHSLGKIARWYKDIIWTDSKATTEVFGIVKLSDDYKSESTETVPTSKTLNDVVKLMKQTGGWNTTYDFNSNIEGDENLQNGQFKVTEHDLEGDIDHYVYIKGLGSAAFTESSAYATAGHTHKYAGSASVGGPATSANKLNTDAGSTANPVYFKNGIPVACTHSLNSTVPSDAVFTDTTYIIESGDSDGQIKITPSVGDPYNVSVKGLGSAAYTNKSDYATAGHTHKYAGSDSVGGAATSANKLNTDAGSDVTPIYFSNGVPVACTYSLNKTVPSNALFTDAKVKQTATTTDADYEILFSSTADNTTRTEGARKNSNLTFNPSTGTLTTTKFVGALSGNATSATTANKLSNTTAIGSSIKPVYFSADGIPVAIDHSIEASVPSDAVFTDTTYIIESGDSDGQIKITPSVGDPYNVSVKGLGSAAYTDSTKYVYKNNDDDTLTQFDGSPPYLLGIESFANGGTVKWQRAIAVSVGSATKLSDIPTAGIGSETKPVFFSGTTGRPVACTYSLNTTVPANAIFTDEKVKQSPITTDGSFEVLFAGSTGNTAKTEGVGKTTSLTFNPSTGALSATSFTGNGSGLTTLNATNISSGTLSVNRLPGSAVTVGTYGPAAGGTLSHSGTFDVPDFTVDAKGRITGAHTRTFTLPDQYVHPTHTAYDKGLYKISVDALGHITSATAVVKDDITALGIPAQDTVYKHPTYTTKTSGLYKITVDSLGHVSATASVTKTDIPALDYVSSTTTRTANTVLAGPVSGAAVAPTFRALVADDLPSHTHTKSQITDFPTSLKNPTSLTVQGNGTTSFTYDGSAAKTLNIKSGTGISVGSDTSGNITITNTSTNTDTKVTQNNSTANSALRVLLSKSANDTNETDVSYKSSKLTFNPSTGTLAATTFSGALSGNADTATALTSSAGSATQPVYFSSGKPVVCTYTLGKSVPSNAVFTDTKVTQTNTTTAADYRVILSANANDTTETTTARKSTNFLANPSTGEFYAKGYRRIDITGNTVDINTYNLSSGSPMRMFFIEKTNDGAANITNIPVDNVPFLLDVELIRWVSATDYITRQIYTNAANSANSYVRYCTSGTWGSWTKRVYTDTHYKSHLITGASATATANAAATNGNVYLNILDNTTVRNSHNIVGSGATTVTSDANGKITISSTNTVYTHPTYTARTGKPTANATPAFGGTFTVSQITSDSTGHVTGATDRTITIPNTTMGAATADTAGTIGLVPAPGAGKQTSFLRGDGTWVIPTNTDTKVTQTATTTNANYEVLFSATADNTTRTEGARKSNNLLFNPSTGVLQISGTEYGAIEIYRKGSANGAAIEFYNDSANSAKTKLGSICMNSADGDILRVLVDGSTYHKICDTKNTSFIRELSSGTKIGTITIAGTSTDLYCQTNTDTKVTSVGNHYTPSGGTTTSASGGTLTDITNSSSGIQVVTGVTKDAAGHVTGVTSVALKSVNTNTTYSFASGDSNGQIKVTPSSGTAYNVSVKGLGSAAYTASTKYVYKDNTSDTLSQFDGAPSYLLGIESFANGGTVKWQSASSVSVGSATKASKLSNTSNIGSATQPVYFSSSGVPVALNYTIQTSVPSGAVFTDNKVTQSVTNAANYRPLVFGKTHTETVEDLAATITDQVYVSTNFYACPKTGVLYATEFSGSGASLTSLNASNISSGTLSADRLATSGATAGSYGPSANATPGYGATFNVPYITVDNKGRVTAISTKTVKIPASDNTNTTYTFATGDTNGTFKVTPSGGSATNIAIKGLGSAAYTASSAYATASHTHNYAGSSSAGGPATSSNQMSISAITIQTGSSAKSHITLETLMNWLIDTKKIVNSDSKYHSFSTSWAYSKNDILQISINGSNKEVQLAGVIFEIWGSVSTYNSGVFRLRIHTAPKHSYTNTSGYSDIGDATVIEYFCNGSEYSPTWRYVSDRSLITAQKTVGLYKIAYDNGGNITKTSAITKADITGLGIPGSDTNTTYTFATGDNSGTFKVTPSGGTATNISIKGISHVAGNSNGLGMTIGAGGLTVLGSGKSASALVTAASLSGTDETLYLTSDNAIEFYVNCQTISERKGITLNESLYLYPNNNNVGSVGTSVNKWKTMYATTFHGALSGNATSASKWATARTLTLSGSVTGSVSIDGSGNVTLSTTTNHSHNYAGSASAGGPAYSVEGGEGTTEIFRHVWFSTDSVETKRAYSDKFMFEPSLGILKFNSWYPLDITDQTVDLNSYTDGRDKYGYRRYICKTTGGGNNISNKPCDSPFLLEVFLIRFVEASKDYITKQVYHAFDKKTYQRFCTNGTWDSWTELKYTDTNTDTKNTAGSTNTSSKIFLIGATSQAANPRTYSHDTAYVGTDGCLYSNSTKVSVEGHAHGLGHSNFTMFINATTNTWAAIGVDGNKYVLKSIRTNDIAPPYLLDRYASGIVFGGSDTRGVLSISYNSPQIRFAGGSNTTTEGGTAKWYITLTGTHNTSYSLDTINHVKQSVTASTGFRGVILGTNNTTNATDTRETTVTGQGYITDKIFAQPSTGSLYATNMNAWVSGTDDVQVGLIKSGNSSWRFLNSEGILSLQNNFYSDKVQSWYNVAQFDFGGTNSIKLMTPPQVTGTNRSISYGYRSIDMGICSKNSWSMSIKWLNNARDTVRGSFGAYGAADALSYYYWGTAYNSTQLRLYVNDNGGLVSQHANGFRIAHSGYGVIFRNDGVDFYILLTDKKTDGSELTGDSWNDKRPLRINLSSGICNINGNAATASEVYSYNKPGSTTLTRYSIPFFDGPVSSSPGTSDTCASGNKALQHNNDFRLNLKEGTTSVEGQIELILGNGVATGTAGNKKGIVTLYASSAYAAQLTPGALTATRTYILPDASGTIALTGHTHSYIPTSNVATLFSGTAAATVTITSMSGYTRLVVFCKNTSNTSFFTVELQAVTGYHYHVMTISPPTGATQSNNKFYGLVFNLASNTSLSVSAGKYSTLSSSAALETGPTVHITKVIGYKF